MKKLILLFVMALVLTSLTMAEGVLAIEANPAEDKEGKTITLKIGSPIINVNGTERLFDAEGTAPILQNGSALVPLRAIFEALSSEVAWDGDTQTITGTRGATEIRLTIGDNYAYKNNAVVRLDAVPQIINGRTMVPLRFISESLGANVEWFGETQMIVITYAEKFLTLGNITIYIGDALTQVKSLLGEVDRIDPSEYDFDWHVYNSDYSKFIMVGVKNGEVEALYSNSAGFKTNNGEYGKTAEKTEKGITLYTDKYDGDKIHACRIISDNVISKEYGDDFYKAQELENFDATNAFRVNHGLSPLKPDDVAQLTARKHSQDMADKNYFSHTNLDGLSPWDRYKNNGGKNFGSGENIFAGRLLGVDAFDGWVNSEGHRGNMLGSHNFLGVGFGYNPSSQYKFYMTQFFSS